MGKMKQKANQVKDLIENGYDEESITLIADVPLTFIEEVKRQQGIENVIVDEIENY
jgi:hypothetical protein